MTYIDLIASVTITLLPIGFLIPEIGYKCGYEYQGVYIGGIYTENKIYICNIGDISFTREHEIGHHLYTKLTDNQKKEYEKLYNKALKIGPRAFLRNYSTNNIQEDFADIFAMTILEQEATNRFIQQRKNFIYLTLQ